MTYVYPPFLPAESKLANGIAHRIEAFYDRDAVPAERTFIHRVSASILLGKPSMARATFDRVV